MWFVSFILLLWWVLNTKPAPVVYDVLPFIDVYVFFAGFYLLVFCPGILHLCYKGHLSVIFYYIFASLGIRIMFLKRNWKLLYSHVSFCDRRWMIEISGDALWAWHLLCETSHLFTYTLISFMCMLLCSFFVCFFLVSALGICVFSRY